MKRYDALLCRVSNDHIELLAALGQTLPVTGLLETDGSVTFYFEPGALNAEVEETIRAWMPEEAGLVIERSSVEEQNWNAEFESSLEPVRVAEGLVITQSWNPNPETLPGDTVITIDPKMSFGTGHHESTRLVLRLMSAMPFAGRSVLDIGTGTGVLAILAAMRGAEPVVAIDNNEWATANAAENIELNKVEGIDLRRCELDEVEGKSFEVILANIHRSVIVGLLPGIVERLASAPDAALLTSGVLIEDYEYLLEPARAHGLIPAAEEREGDWIATRFVRNAEA